MQQGKTFTFLGSMLTEFEITYEYIIQRANDITYQISLILNIPLETKRQLTAYLYHSCAANIEHGNQTKTGKLNICKRN